MRIKSALTHRGRSANLKSATWKVSLKRYHLKQEFTRFVTLPESSEPGGAAKSFRLLGFNPTLSVVSGYPLSGPSEDVCRAVFSFLPAADLPASAPLTHTPQHTHLHQPAQHGHEVHTL